MTDLEHKLTVSLIKAHRNNSQRYLDRVKSARSGGEAKVLLEMADQHCTAAEKLAWSLRGSASR